MKITAAFRRWRGWLAENGASIFFSWDFKVGIASAVLAAVLVGTSRDVAANGVTILLAEAAIGVALMAVVLAAMAIFATFFDDLYRQVLERASGSIRPALLPYEVVAILGGASTVLAVLVALAWPGVSGPVQTAGIAIVTGFTAWSLAGGIQLVGLTAWHADRRAELLRGIEAARSQLAERRREKQRSAS